MAQSHRIMAVGEMKTTDLEGAELDYWVAKAEGWKFNWSKHNYYIITGPNGERDLCWEGWSEYDPETGEKNKIPAPSTCMLSIGYVPSFDWQQGGAIIERELIDLEAVGHDDEREVQEWMASHRFGKKSFYADSPLIAAMRAFVASKFGENVE